MNNLESNDPMVVDAPHYNQHPSGVECIDYIRWFPGDLFVAQKHMWRLGLKEGVSKLQDVEKAVNYLTDWYKTIETLTELPKFFDRFLPSYGVCTLISQEYSHNVKNAFLNIWFSCHATNKAECLTDLSLAIGYLKAEIADIKSIQKLQE